MFSSNPSPADTLYDREDEQLTIGLAVERIASGVATTVCVQGIAGIGKTSLLSQARALVEANDWWMLHARGDELEQGFGFGTVHQLVEHVLPTTGQDDRSDLFEGPAAFLLPLTNPAGSGEWTAPDQSSIGHGLRWLLANMAQRKPVAIIVDDAQWCDATSLRCLRYAMRRLEGNRVGLFLATRPPRDDEFAEFLRGLEPEHRLVPGPLSRAGIGQMAAAATGAEVDDAELDRWCLVTGGLPLLVGEVLLHHDLLEEAVDSLDRPLITMSARRSRLSPEARRFADVASVAGDGSTRWLIDRIANTESCSHEVQWELTAAALFLDTDEVRFVHPTIRTSLLEALRPDTARRIHGEVARLLLSSGGPVEAVAGHLMYATPTRCDASAEALMAAATRARAVGSAEQALRLLRRAMLERPTGDLRDRILGDLAVAAAVAGDPGWPDALEDHLRGLPTSTDRARAHLRVGAALARRGRLDEATRVLVQGLDVAADDEVEPDLRMELLALLAANTRIDVQRRLQLEDRLARELQRSDIDESPTARSVLALLAYHRAITTGSASEVRSMARTALLHPKVTDDEILAHQSAFSQGILALSFADDAESLDEVLAHGIGAAERREDDALFAAMSNLRGTTRLDQGRVDEALDDLLAAVTTLQLQRAVSLPGAAADLALCRAARDEPVLALAALEVPEIEAVHEQGAPYTHYLSVRGVIRLEQGDDRGFDDLRTALARQRVNGSESPAAVPALRLAEALVKTSPAEARQLLSRAATVADQFGSPRVLAGVARVRALLEPERAVELLAGAAALLEPTCWGMERMRVRRALGSALVATGALDDARAVLRHLLEEADAGGARAMAEVARSQLWALGVRPRRPALSGPNALTPSEQAVALLAASGLTNREIATRRFVTVKAIEYHLANAYRKLNIINRAGLAVALDAT
jgi:DNA-binding CsgD family transcriptional regulator